MNLEKPFGFFLTLKSDIAHDNEEDELSPEQRTQVENFMREQEKKYEKQEAEINKNIENVTQGIANRLGFAYVPWFTLTKIVLGIYTALTVFVLFFRPDFVNLTVCTAGIYMLNNTD